MLLSAILLVVLGLSSLKAQTLHARENSGFQSRLALNDIRKMSFSNGNIMITRVSDEVEVFQLKEFKVLDFSNIVTALDASTNTNTDFSVFPNPVKDVLNVQLNSIAGQYSNITILNLDGTVVKSYKNAGKGMHQIDLSDLPQGIYLCQTGNENVVKSIKIVKQ